MEIMSDNKANRGDNGSDGRLADDSVYVLKLYIVATTPNSLRAVANVRSLCEEYLQGRYDLEVIDISTQPQLAKKEQLIGAPTLVKLLPLPLRKFIGDMSRKERLIAGLEIGLA
jgi:circadian clock protein KaiB